MQEFRLTPDVILKLRKMYDDYAQHSQELRTRKAGPLQNELLNYADDLISAAEREFNRKD